MVADSFPQPGAVASGRLRLWVQTDTLRRYYRFSVISQEWHRMGERPLVGTLEIDPASIAAPATGDPRSTDPDAPGVYFEAGDGRFHIGRSPGTLDGTSTDLLPERASERGFRGRWHPDYGIGSPVDPATGGWAHLGGVFCAERLGRPTSTSAEGSGVDRVVLDQHGPREVR